MDWVCAADRLDMGPKIAATPSRICRHTERKTRSQLVKNTSSTGGKHVVNWGKTGHLYFKVGKYLHKPSTEAGVLKTWAGSFELLI